MRNILVLLLSLMHLSGYAQGDFTQYVDPFIGTGGHGHTYPGAALPFGMVQLSPDTRLKGWDGCSGYHYSDDRVYGFSHTHLSGTGVSDYGDVLLMPTVGEISLDNGDYSSTFKKENEFASAGYYSVYLDDPQVRVELTVTKRTGLHQYTFPETSSANVIIDLQHRDKLTDGAIQITGSDELSGYRVSTKWSADQHIYFVIRFSKPFKEFGLSGRNGDDARQRSGTKNMKAWVRFQTTAGEVVHARVGISAVSIEGARKNLEAEQPDLDFERTRAHAERTWNNALGKIEIEDADEKQKTIFYTALYHAMLTPNLYQDVDGSYRGRDGMIHHAANHTNYTVFSLWDTYRALHPLFNLIERERNSDFIKTFLVQYDQAGLLPIWELAAYETFCMIGYHSVSVIADAYLKGITDFDAHKALEAMQHGADMDEKRLKQYKENGPMVVKASCYRYKKGNNDYLKYGFIRQRFFSNSVSKTLEYAYDDWCIAQMASALGDSATYREYLSRASNYRHVFDRETGFMRARNKRNFRILFNPYKVTQSYTEANAWQYATYVPHDVSGLMERMGGPGQMATFLDTLFTTSSGLKGMVKRDVSGLMGQYAHGNEPSHHVAYLYTYAGQPWKTQALVPEIMDAFYKDQPDGLAGNEDCGQMSAWYIFSSLGFYPVCPGSDHYAVGAPRFDQATIRLESGNTFTLRTLRESKDDIYIREAMLNGVPYTRSYLKYSDILEGGVLEFTMDDKPNKNWGSGADDIPNTNID